MGRTRKDARMCTSFVVHDGKALTRELLALCPSLQREYELLKWCTNTHAQTLIWSQVLVDDGMLFYRCVIRDIFIPVGRSSFWQVGAVFSELVYVSAPTPINATLGAATAHAAPNAAIHTTIFISPHPLSSR